VDNRDENHPMAVRINGLGIYTPPGTLPATVAAVDCDQQVVLTARRIGFEQFEEWARKNLRRTDAVTLESTGNAWYLHDLLAPLVASVTVANPIQVALIAKARVKTDPRDAMTLARLLAARVLPSVSVPPTQVRELRALLAHRHRLVKQRTQLRNRLRAVLIRHNLVAPRTAVFTPGQRTWWDGLELPASEKLRVRHDLSLLDSLEPLVKQVEAELARQSSLERWEQQVALLLQLPGSVCRAQCSCSPRSGISGALSLHRSSSAMPGSERACTAQAKNTMAAG
jgi:transposase